MFTWQIWCLGRVGGVVGKIMDEKRDKPEGGVDEKLTVRIARDVANQRVDHRCVHADDILKWEWNALLVLVANDCVATFTFLPFGRDLKNRERLNSPQSVRLQPAIVGYLHTVRCVGGLTGMNLNT